MVAIEPLSKYWNGGTLPSPASLALITLPTYLPSCMAGWATPGSLFSETMSPMANTSGCPGSVQSGFSTTRPAGSVSAPALPASCFASGEACTPAAQIRVRVGMTSSPSLLFTVTLRSSMPTARVPSLISTPIFSSTPYV